MDIAIIGAGAIGKAVKAALAPGFAVFMWDKREGVVPAQERLEDLIAKADIIFLCMPSSGFREAVSAVDANRKPDAIVVSLAKGMERASGQMIYDILGKVFPENCYALLSGPMLAEEIASGMGGAAMVASKNPEIYKKLRTIFKKDYLKLEQTGDIYSVAYAGILKNVYTLIIGILEGLGYGNNIKGYFSGKILLELKKTSAQLGLDEQIVFGIAGVDDFIATAFSPFSLNREAGEKIALGQEPPQSEGLVSLPHILNMAKDLEQLKILSLLKTIIIEKKDPKAAIYGYLYQE